jgi:hypothetical protein
MNLTLWQVAGLVGFVSVLSGVAQGQQSGQTPTTTDKATEQSPPRPSEDSMFGAPAPPAQAKPAQTPTSPPVGQAPPPQREGRVGEDVIFGATPGEAKISTTAGPSNPLTIGGFVYFNEQTNYSLNQPVDHTPLTLPVLAQAYFDARPNDRIRAYLVGRLEYNPLASTTPFGSFGYSVPSGITVLLDQAWLNFDLYHEVFVTVGRQHIKWGTGRFWNPTDFLNPIKLNPLVPFDTRTGLDMAKFHIPVESLGWNFYGLLLLDNFAPVVGSTLGQLGGALRAEIVLGKTEFSLSAVAAPQSNYNPSLSYIPKFGADISAGIGPFDVYAELALQRARDVVQVRPLAPGSLTTAQEIQYAGELYGAVQCLENPNSPAVQEAIMNGAPSCAVQVSNAMEAAFPAYNPSGIDGIIPAAVAGFNFQLALADRASLTMGAEYFFNGAGYNTDSIYPVLAFVSAYQQYFTPLYLGQHYAAVFATLPNPGSWTNTTITFSTLGNLSDRSFLSRLDFSVVVLTYLTVDLYGQAHYGHPGGELRFTLPSTLSLPTGTEQLGNISVPSPAVIPTPLFDFGIGLRANI